MKGKRGKREKAASGQRAAGTGKRAAGTGKTEEDLPCKMNGCSETNRLERDLKTRILEADEIRLIARKLILEVLTFSDKYGSQEVEAKIAAIWGNFNVRAKALKKHEIYF